MKLEQPQAYRTIFFDAGLTLLYPHPTVPEICLQVCHQLGLHINLAQIQAQMEAAEDFYFRHMSENRQTWADEQAIASYWITYYTHLLRPLVAEHDEARLYALASAINDEFDKHTNWRVYNDAYETLETLQAHGYTLGVISDWGIALSPILHKLKLTTYFDCLVTSATTRAAKPSPHLYETALQRADAIPDYTLHIGDSYINDIIGARSVGITPILLDRTHRLTEQRIDCIVIHSLTDVLDLLEAKRLEREHQNT